MLRTVIVIDEDLWVVDDKFALPKGLLPFAIPSFLGRCSLRMTIVKLNDSEILLHSPTVFSDELAKQMYKLGRIKYIVGPSVVHNTYLLDWKNAFPEAELIVAPYTHKRVPPLKDYPILDDEKPIVDENLGQILMQGHHVYETLFYHRKTKTLICTDLAYGINPESDFSEKVWLFVTGVRNPLGLTFYIRKLVFDPEKFRLCLHRVLEWDFERIIMSHGGILDRGGKQEFKKIWASFL